MKKYFVSCVLWAMPLAAGSENILTQIDNLKQIAIETIVLCDEHIPFDEDQRAYAEGFLHGLNHARWIVEMDEVTSGIIYPNVPRLDH